MKALSKNLLYNAKKHLKSGCNLVLYCGGNFKRIRHQIIKKLNKIDNFT